MQLFRGFVIGTLNVVAIIIFIGAIVAGVLQGMDPAWYSQLPFAVPSGLGPIVGGVLGGIAGWLAASVALGILFVLIDIQDGIRDLHRDLTKPGAGV